MAALLVGYARCSTDKQDYPSVDRGDDFRFRSVSVAKERMTILSLMWLV